MSKYLDIEGTRQLVSEMNNLIDNSTEAIPLETLNRMLKAIDNKTVAYTADNTKVILTGLKMLQVSEGGNRYTPIVAVTTEGQYIYLRNNNASFNSYGAFLSSFDSYGINMLENKEAWTYYDDNMSQNKYINISGPNDIIWDWLKANGVKDTIWSYLYENETVLYIK